MLDLLRAAVEARLYPYGDLVTTPGRCVAEYQLSRLAHAQRVGMTDREVADYLSVTLMGGGNTVYRGDTGTLEWAGTVEFGGRWGPPDAMGRRRFWWRIAIAARANTVPGAPVVSWEAEEAYDAFRRAFAVPSRPDAPPAAEVQWESGQALLF